MTTERWIETNKGDRPFTAGALAFMHGLPCNYGCHYGLRSTRAWAIELFKQGWIEAKHDYERNS